jgi:hypothetical protein
MKRASLPHRVSNQRITVVIPRSSWTFSKLPGESDDQAVNRFIYAVLSDKDGTRKLSEKLLKEAFCKEATEEVSASWMNRYPQIIDDKTVDELFQFTTRNE